MSILSVVESTNIVDGPLFCSRIHIGSGCLKNWVCILTFALFLISCATMPPMGRRGMVLVPEGTFKMGFDTLNEGKKWGDRDEEPIHEVYLNGYWIDLYEVTAFDFSRFLNQRKKKAKEYFETGEAVTIEQTNGVYKPRLGLDRYPANRISWYGADAYCRSIDKRLPTEAEWEKAARGSSEYIFPWGNVFPDNSLTTFRRKFLLMGFDAMEPVDGLPKGRSPYGLHHMAGNVWEWVNDWYHSDYYKVSPKLNPEGPENGTSKILRGGNWYYKAYYLRTTYRFNERPNKFKVWQGFRCAKNFN